MLAIALRYGISLEDLLAANPEVNPRALSVDTVLIIPPAENSPSVPVTATPISIIAQSVDCYLVRDGVSCLLLVINDKARPLENISVRIILYDQGGEIISEGTAITPLNLIPPDEAMPVTIFFPGSYSGKVSAVGTILTGGRVPKNDQRYLNIWSEIDQTEISEDGSQAVIKGTVGLPRKSVTGNLVWIVAIAYDSQGRAVGVRKIEQPPPLEPGQSRDYEITVFSLGPQIADVVVIAEARP
jgi:hypothetical protein